MVFAFDLRIGMGVGMAVGIAILFQPLLSPFATVTVTAGTIIGRLTFDGGFTFDRRLDRNCVFLLKIINLVDALVPESEILAATRAVALVTLSVLTVIVTAEALTFPLQTSEFVTHV
jgi:hypothetical protein